MEPVLNIVADGLPCQEGVYGVHNICMWMCGVVATLQRLMENLQWTWTMTGSIDRVLALGHTATSIVYIGSIPETETHHACIAPGL
jgi:hypothetical protein